MSETSLIRSNATNYTIPERIATLDFLRGFAIFCMTLMHTFEHLYDYTWVKKDVNKILEELPLPILILGLIFGFFMAWNSLFLLISSIVNALSITNRARKGVPIQHIISKQIITGIGILLAGVFADNLGYWGYFGQSILTGDWKNLRPLWQRFFTINTLQMIGWSMIITGIIHALLMRKEGFKKFIRNIFVYAGLVIGVLVVTPFLHNWVDNMQWVVPENPPPSIYDNTKWPSEYFQAENASFKTWILAILAGDLQPIFPYIGTAFIGSMLGLTFARTKPVKRLPLIGGLSGLGIMGIGGIFLKYGFYSLSNGRPAMGNYLVIFGGEICAIMLLLWLVEYRGKSNKFANNFVIKHFRLWGMASLTIYCLQILEILPRYVLSTFISFHTPINLLESSLFGYGKEYLAFLVGVFVIIYFESLVYIWSKFNFRYSFEWFIVKMQNIGNSATPKRLDVDLIMDKVKWINFKQSKNMLKN